MPIFSIAAARARVELRRCVCVHVCVCVCVCVCACVCVFVVVVVCLREGYTFLHGIGVVERDVLAWCTELRMLGLQAMSRHLRCDVPF